MVQLVLLMLCLMTGMLFGSVIRNLDGWTEAIVGVRVIAIVFVIALFAVMFAYPASEDANCAARFCAGLLGFIFGSITG